MKDFLEKWNKDRRFRTKTKLILYTAFVVIVAIYAFTLDSDNSYKDLSNIKNEIANTKKTEENIIKVPEEYNYTITIKIDDKEYEYTGMKLSDKEYIEKKVDDKKTNYVYQNNNYYIEDTTKIDNYIITTKDEVYDIINYNYINLSTINEYLKKATKNDNQYLVYLKDIILGNDSDGYIVIDINENNIFIDYTVLMKEFNNNLNKYQVIIEIKEKE